MSLDANIFKNFLINEMFEYNNEGKRINRAEGENKFNLLSQILKDCNAVIAGGSVLSAYVDSRSRLNDIDVYVNKKNAIKLKNRIKEIGYTDIFKGDIQSQYDNSFFVKNNIIARFPVAMKDTKYFRENTYIDIIIVSDNVDIIQVVNNFDLTFCEIWYDGTHVHAADPKGVLEKKGYLKKDYVEKLLVCFNKFTINRIDKYKYRGFEIRYDPKVNLSEIILNNDKDCGDGKVITSPEKWVAGFIFKNITSFLFLPDIFKYIDINNLRNISPFSSMEQFIELLPIYNLGVYRGYGEPRYKEARFFFKNILFDIICKCTTDNVYSMDSVVNVLDCLGVKPPMRKEFISGLIAHTQLYNDEYYEYILDIAYISKEDIKKYKRQNNINNEYLSDEEDDEDMETDYEEEEEDKNDRKRKRGDSESEDEEVVSYWSSLGGRGAFARKSDEEVEAPIVVRNKRKRDDEYEVENADFMTTDIANITDRMTNLRARDEDNIVRKKRRTGDDSGDDDSITLINKSNNNQFHTVTFNRSYLETIIRNKKNLFFECTSANKIVTPIVIYAKIPLNHRKTFYCFVPIDSIKKIFADNRKVYYLYPVLENQRQKGIQNSGSLNNINTCRNNGNILVYRIKSQSRVYFEGTEISERF